MRFLLKYICIFFFVQFYCYALLEKILKQQNYKVNIGNNMNLKRCFLKEHSKGIEKSLFKA